MSGISATTLSATTSSRRSSNTSNISNASDSLNSIPNHMSKLFTDAEFVNKSFGVSSAEIKRQQALKRLGITEEEFRDGQQVVANVSAPLVNRKNVKDNSSLDLKKEERLTGYTTTQLSRNKALNVLGTSEESVDEDTSRKLASIGSERSIRSAANTPDPATNEEPSSALLHGEVSSTADVVAVKCCPCVAGSVDVVASDFSGRLSGTVRQALFGDFDGEPSYAELKMMYDSLLDRHATLNNQRNELKQQNQTLRENINVMRIIISDGDAGRVAQAMAIYNNSIQNYDGGKSASRLNDDDDDA